jgi:DNA invertase Pin-like site-specific DNA recombinase
MPRNAAIYVRANASDPIAGNRVLALRSLAEARGYQVMQVLEEIETGAKKRRPELDVLLESARQGTCQAVFVWAIDQLGRSIHSTISTILELDSLGVSVVSHQEPWLEMNGPVRPLLVSIFAWLVEQERTHLIDRTKAGLARARKAGKRLGRPQVSVDLDKAVRLRGQGLSIAATAKKLGVSTGRLHSSLRLVQQSLSADEDRGARSRTTASVTNQALSASARGKK